MLHFSKYLKTDFYKAYHSKLIGIHFVIPILGVIIFLSYYAISPWNQLQKVIAYIQCIAVAFPFIISILVAMVYEQEEEAGAFKYFLSTPRKKFIPHFSKLFLLLVLSLVATTIAILGFGILFFCFGTYSIGILFYMKVTLIMFFSNIALYMIQYLVVFSFGKGASIGLGVIGSILTALMATGLGDGIWTILPWGYSIRLSSYFFQNTFQGSINLITEKQIIQAITLCVIYMVLFSIFQVIFSNYWEGRRELY